MIPLTVKPGVVRQPSGVGVDVTVDIAEESMGVAVNGIGVREVPCKGAGVLTEGFTARTCSFNGRQAESTSKNAQQQISLFI